MKKVSFLKIILMKHEKYKTKRSNLIHQQEQALKEEEVLKLLTSVREVESGVLYNIQLFEGKK